MSTYASVASGLVIALALAACDRPATTPAAAPPEAAPDVRSSRPVMMPRVVLTAADGSEHPVTVEVVREERELQRGLMFRRHLDPDAGMLFLMGEERQQSFWMKNTMIPLDMIFIHADFTVAGVVENAEPQTLTSRYVDDTSTYVLEVNGGWARKHGIGRGAKTRFENVRGVP